MNFTSYLKLMVLKNLGYQLYQNTVELDVALRKMTQLLNTNDRKLLMKVAKFVYLGMKEYTSLPDVVSENIDTADLTEYLIMTVNRYIP